jgi:hypothetical protein
LLIIADPASGRLSLPGARSEGLAVLDAVRQAQQAWQGAYRFEVTVRVGSHAEQDGAQKQMLEDLLQKLRGMKPPVKSAEPCDPLELAKLIVNEGFDAIHYAGHGVFDKDAGLAGWVFDEDCVLSAREIFRVRQVPRLVFANACFSAVTAEREGQPTVGHQAHRQQLVGLAQAFFERGIQNYLGTGWEVDDALAAECARRFYCRALGLGRPGNDGPLIGTAPPAIFGYALAEARDAIRLRRCQAAGDPDGAKKRATWGAYQLYGKANDKLLPLLNTTTTPA